MWGLYIQYSDVCRASEPISSTTPRDIFGKLVHFFSFSLVIELIIYPSWTPVLINPTPLNSCNPKPVPDLSPALNRSLWGTH
jgi:hypothetical protein